MRSKRTIVAILVLSAMVITTLGYALGGDWFSNPSAVIVAEANGEKISLQEVNIIYEQEKTYYGLGDTVTEEQTAFAQSLKEDILRRLIEEKVMLQKATAAGYVVDEAARTEAQTEYDGILTSIAAQMASEDTTAGTPTEGVDYQKKARDYAISTLAAVGRTEDSFVESIAQSIVIERFFTASTQGITVTEDEIAAYYATQLELQRSAGVADGDNAVALLQPASVRVKHILIELPAEQRDEYNRLLSEDTAEAAQAYLDAKLKEIEPTALSVLSQAKSGANFEALIAEHGKDPGMTTYPEGYTVMRDGSFVESFEDAAFTLKVNEISGLVASQFGYHILKAYQINPELIYPLSEKTDAIRHALEDEKADAHWDELVEQWHNEATILSYPDRL